MNSSSPPIARVRDRLREETAALILDAAEEVIGDDGLFSARMEKIAGRVGVSVGTLYNHFENREALLDALRESRIRLLSQLLSDALSETASLPVRDRVRALLATMRTHAQRHGRLFTALMVERLGPASCRPRVEARSVVAEHATEIVERAAAAGELAPDGGELLSEALATLARMALVRAVEGRCTDGDLDRLTDLFLKGAAR